MDWIGVRQRLNSPTDGGGGGRGSLAAGQRRVIPSIHPSVWGPEPFFEGICHNQRNRRLSGHRDISNFEGVCLWGLEIDEDSYAKVLAASRFLY